MAAAKKIQESIATSAAEDAKIYANAEKDWISAGILLIPVFTRKEYLTSLGYEHGETEYYKAQSIRHNLKPSKLGVLTNHFKKLVKYIDAFKGVDLNSITVNRAHDLFKDAKKLGKGKITLANVKVCVQALVARNALKTTDDDTLMNEIKDAVTHANNLNLGDLSDPKNLSTRNTVKKSTAAKATEDIKKIKEIKETKKATASAPTKTASEQKKDLVVESVSKKAELQKPTEKVAEKAPVEQKTTTPTVSATAKPEAKATATEAPRVEAIVTHTPTKTESDSVRTESSTLVDAYRTLPIDLQSHIIEIAMLMQGEQDIALLKSLDEKQTSTILKTIQLINK